MHIISIRSRLGKWCAANPVAPCDCLPSGSRNSANPRDVRYLSQISWRIRITLLLLCSLSTGLFGQSTLTAPVPGSVLTGTSVNFSWTASVGATAYSLWLGSTGAGSVNLYCSHSITATSVTAAGLPTNGETVYARLYTSFNGKTVYTDYTYTAATQLQAAITSPPPGSTLTGSTATFTWSSATAAGATYSLWLGSTGAGSVNLYSSHSIAATSVTATGLPTNGETIYARLYTTSNGKSVYTDYIYNAATQLQAAMTSPPLGSTLTAPTATFTWSPATTAGAAYSLWLGSTGAGSYDLYNSHETSATSVKVTGLPTNGETVYARLYTIINGNSLHTDYTYTATGTLPVLSAFSCSSAGVTGVANDYCTVTLSGPAPGTGSAVSLSSSNAAVTLPATVTVSANATSAGFTATAASVGTSETATLKATSGSISKTFLLQLNPTVPTLTVTTSSSPSTYGIAVTLTATISSGPSGTVTFYDGGTPIGTGVISGTGASITTSGLLAGSHTITAYWGGNSSYAAVTSAAVTQVVNKASPTLTWTAPASISYGTALSATQLNSTSNVAGTFAYSPASGTVLNAGAQSLSVTFTPTDTADYSTATSSVSIAVNQAVPAISWATPVAIASGTALSITQLDATSPVAGTFVYTPAAGVVLAIGSQTLSVTFTPTDTVDYTTATKSVTLAVSATASFVQAAAGASTGSASTFSHSFTTNTAAGNLILVGFDFNSGAVSSVTDSQGNIFTRVGSQLTSPGGAFSAVYYANNIKGGADTVTIALSATSGYILSYMAEYTGVDQTNPIDVQAGATGSSGTASSGAVTTTYSGDVIYGYCWGDGACAAGSGFAARSTFDSNVAEDLTAGSPASHAATGTATSGWTMQMVALKPAASGTAAPAPAITSATTASGTVGSAFSYQISASNTPASFGASGLPAGLSVNAATGLISGTPTAAGTSTATVSATNSAGTGSATLTITIAGAGPSLSINATSIPFGSVTVNTMATQTVTLTSNGSAAVTVSSASVTGTGFTLAGSTYSATLAPGQTATLGVQFEPTSTGAATGQLTIKSNSTTNSTAAIALTGTGTAASYSVDLGWDAPVDSAVPIAGYNVYRAVSGSSSYALLNTALDTQTNYVDSAVQTGMSYDYMIESVDTSGVASAPTSPILVAVP